MAALAATSSATPSLQSTLIRSRLAVARSEEAQAESSVLELRSQADAAEADLQKRQDTVRTLTDQSGQADPTYQPRALPLGRIINLSA